MGSLWDHFCATLFTSTSEVFVREPESRDRGQSGDEIYRRDISPRIRTWYLDFAPTSLLNQELPSQYFSKGDIVVAS
jgi:hypothetical protein